VKWYKSGEKQYACLDMKLASGITEEGGKVEVAKKE
jgi:hypothetical protein